jgi:hypothetical protein
MARTPKRLLRILLAGSALAAGFLAVDLLSSPDSASAADLVPDTVSSLTTPLTPIVEVVAQTSAPVVAPVASTVAPVIAPIADPVVTSVIAPLEPAVTVLTEPLAPVAHAALNPFVPVLQPLLPVVVDVLSVLPATPLAAVTPAEGALVVGGGLIFGAAIAASTAPFLPLPANSPLQRNAPAGSTPLAFFGFVAVIMGGLVATLRSALSAPAAGQLLPLAPTFASDTTPD